MYNVQDFPVEMPRNAQKCPLKPSMANLTFCVIDDYDDFLDIFIKKDWRILSETSSPFSQLIICTIEMEKDVIL